MRTTELTRLSVQYQRSRYTSACQTKYIGTPLNKASSTADVATDPSRTVRVSASVFRCRLTN
ncbi:hypothetical protein Y695_04062 [Hydrogenophaga sp. T4]|nr:hypothetical protein Y695_04062 [Hydrogenophaga sp. T4]